MAIKYSFQNYEKTAMARAKANNLQISLKKSVEVAKEIQGRKVSFVINYLEKVSEKEAVVPYRRYRAEMPHRRGKGIDAGGYPVNISKELLKLVKSAQKNASELEINGVLYVLSASARKGSTRYHPGRYSGRKIKSTNFEIILAVKEAKTSVKKEANN